MEDMEKMPRKSIDASDNWSESNVRRREEQIRKLNVITPKIRKSYTCPICHHRSCFSPIELSVFENAGILFRTCRKCGHMASWEKPEHYEWRNRKETKK